MNNEVIGAENKKIALLVKSNTIDPVMRDGSYPRNEQITFHSDWDFTGH